MPKQYLNSGLFALLLIISSCSSGTKKQTTENDPSKIVLGKSKSSAPVVYSNEMSHWIGSYLFTDSPQSSMRITVSKEERVKSSNFVRLPRNPQMVLVISVERSRLKGSLSLSNVDYPRTVNVFIRGNAKEIGIYFLSENSSDKAEEEKGELLFILKKEHGALSTLWKAWYPRSNNLVENGFVKLN